MSERDDGLREMSYSLRVGALTRTLVELERSADRVARVARDALVELHSLRGTVEDEERAVAELGA
jgi:hypothetical protein